MANSATYKSFRLTKSDWQRIGEEMVTSIVVRSGAGVDRNGKSFPAYTKRYAELKALGFKRDDENSKRGALKGVATSRRTATPDFRLSGDTLNSTRVLASDEYGFVVGWTGDAANRVAGNEKRGKHKIGGFSPQEIKYIVGEVDRVLNRLWNSEPGKIDL